MQSTQPYLTKMRIQHTCKFCSSPVTLEMDEAGVEYFGLEFWKSLSACNRCADYREKKRGITERLVGYSVDWSRHQNKQVPLGEKELNRLMESIIASTKKYADLVCRFNRIPSLWQQDFAQQIMDMPHKTMTILGFYERNIIRTHT